MNSLMLINVNERPFDKDALRQDFRRAPGFRELREDTPAGDSIEAEFTDGQGVIIADLNASEEAVSMRFTSRATIRVAWAIKEDLNTPLRIFDSMYAFDFLMTQFFSAEQIEHAIDEVWSRM